MRALTLLCYVGVFTSSIIAYTYATVGGIGGQYSVNVHFVPPLVTAPCQIAQFWTPSNVTCGLCFCMTGTLSRCIPQPGCNPNVPQNSTTTTPNPNESTTPGGESSSSSDASQSAAAPPEGENSTDSPSSEKPGSSSTEKPTEKPESTPGKLRAAKPGKTRRRRRHVSQSGRA